MKRILMLVAVLMAAIGFHSATVSALSPNDTADLKITNIEGNPTVTLYKIGRGQYTAAGDTFIKFEYTSGINDSSPTSLTLTETGPTTSEINAIANALDRRTHGAYETLRPTVSGSSVTQRVTGAGVYIAILSGADNGRIYNPILLAASYNGNGSLVGGNISAQSSYLHGDTAVAKSTLPKIDKEIIGGTVKDTKAPVGEQDTVSFGDVVEYSLTLTMPTYSTNANNKTIFVTDRLSNNLELDYSSLTVKWKGQTIKVNGDNKFIAAGNIELGTARKETGGFNLLFNYDNLDRVAPVITYKAVVEESFQEGAAGAANTATFIYANEPNDELGTWPHVFQIPSTGKNTAYLQTQDTEKVYTYRLAFKKVDSLDGARGLENADFGIYSDPQATQLVGVVRTSRSGYAQSTQLAAGNYYLKELKAPNGYTLNTTIYPVELNWTAATTKSAGGTHTQSLTADVNASYNKVQIGWKKGGNFYKVNQKPAADAEAVYLAGPTTFGGDGSAFTPNSGAGAGVVMMADIKNTKLGELPSTGGMGTYLFTFVGALVMAVAAGLYFHKRKQA